MGRVTQGVRGIQLRGDDGVVGMVVVRRDASLCTITEQGYAKRTQLGEYPVQKRGGVGTITLDVTEKTGRLIAAKELLEGDELMVIGASGKATRIAAGEVPVQGRATQGRRTITLDDGDRVVEVARVAQERDEGENGDTVATTDSEGEPSPSGDVAAKRGRRRGTQLDLMQED
jgi:DNA gyrase subunit A